MKKMNTKILSLLLAFAMVVTSLTIVSDTTQAAAKGKVKSVTITKPSSTKLVMAKGKTYQLKTKITVTKKNANKKLVYTSSKKKVAKVSMKGKIKAIKAGTAKITVRSKANKKAKASIQVIVGGTKVKSVKISKKSASLHQGETLTLTASIKTAKATVKDIIWKSTKPSVATVAADGVVTAVNPGTTKIYAKSNDGSGKKAYCKVKVVAAVISIQSMKVLNEDTVQFALSYPKALTPADIAVTYGTQKASDSKMSVSGVATTDNQNYKIRMENAWEYGDNVAIAIPSLNGTNQTQGQFLYTFACKPVYTAYTVGEPINETVGIYGIYSQLGDSTVTGGSYPGGITYDANTQIYNGVFNATCENLVTSRTVTSPFGGTTESDIHWSVGSDNVIVSTNHPLSLMQKNYTYTDTIFMAGGSGHYTFEVAGAMPDSNLYFYTNENGFYFGGSCKEATTYTIPVIVRDKRNPSIGTTVPVTIEILPSIRISGSIVDSQGRPEVGADLTFLNLKTGVNTYYESDEAGQLAGFLTPGTYVVSATTGGSRKESFGEVEIAGDMTFNSVLNDSYKVSTSVEVPAGVSKYASSISVIYLKGGNTYSASASTNELASTYLTGGTYCMQVTLYAKDDYGNEIATYVATKYVAIGGNMTTTVAANEWTTSTTVTNGLVRFSLNPVVGKIEDFKIRYSEMNDLGSSSSYSDGYRFPNGAYRFIIRAVMSDGHIYQAIKDIAVNGADVLSGVAATDWTLVE